MAKEIKQKIVLSGEKEYSQALKDATRNLKPLQTALKAETAELGKNASEQDKARVKAASLKEQIAEQEKVVATLTAALGEVKEKYSDNEAEVARWEQKLNNARATLANMKNDLEGTGEGFRAAEKGAADAVTAAKSFSDTLKDLGGIGDGVADAIEGIFSGVIDRITDAVGEMWGLISSTAAKANNWTDTRATAASANSFEDLQAVVSKLVLGGKGQKITELLGISDVGYKDQWQYAMDAMDMLYAKASSGQNINPILETLFGEKKSTAVMDLLGDWGQIQQAIATGAFNGNTSGYGLSDQELGTMNDLWVRINEIETKWTALKENFAAGFGVATLDLMVNVEGTLDGLAAFMNAKDEGEKQKALEQIRTNIEEFFRKVAQLIRECIGILDEVGKELQESDDPLTRMIGSIFENLSGALQWIVDNQGKVIAAFKAILGTWLVAKISSVAGKLASLVAQIKVIQTFKGLGTAGGAAASAAGGAAAKAGTGTAAGAGGAAVAGVVAAMVAGGVAGAEMIKQNLRDENLNRVYGGKNGAGDIIDTMSPEAAARAAEYFRLYRIAEGTEAAFDARDALQAALEKDGVINSEQGVSLLEKTFDQFMDEMDVDGTVARLKSKHPEIFGEGPAGEIQEWESLDTIKELGKSALEDLFDAWRDYENGKEGEDEYDRAWEYAKGILGDSFGDVIEKMIQEMDKNPNWMKEGDIPLSWWNGAMNPANWNGGNNNGAMNQNGITSSDLQSFQKLPSGMQRAVEAGARAGVSGIRVDLDGAAVGRLVAPYVKGRT